MFNQYGSRTRRFIGGNFYSAAITPPTTFAIAPLANTRFLRTLAPSQGFGKCLLNPNSNAIVKRIGIYSNFADGLVWGDPDGYPNPFQVAVLGKLYNRDSYLTGSYSVSAGSVNVTGDTSTLASGNAIILGGFPCMVDTIVGANAFTIYDPIPVTITNQVSTQKLLLIGTGLSPSMFINTLNDMYDCDGAVIPTGAINPSNIAPAYMFLQVAVRVSKAMALLTKSISTAFSGDICALHVQCDVEFTEKNFA